MILTKWCYPDPIVDYALLWILVILFLGVNTNPICRQVLPYLSKGQRSNTGQTGQVNWFTLKACIKAGNMREILFMLHNENISWRKWKCYSVYSLTLSLNSCLSSMVSVSALAMTGTMLTIFPNLFMNSTSMGRNLETQTDLWSVWGLWHRGVTLYKAGYTENTC